MILKKAYENYLNRLKGKLNKIICKLLWHNIGYSTIEPEGLAIFCKDVIGFFALEQELKKAGYKFL